MLSRIVPTLFLLFGLALPGHAQDNPIVSRMKAFTEAFNAGDPKTISEMYTEDGALLVPGGGIVAGREAISKYYASATSAGGENLQYKIIEIRQVGPATAVEIGEARLVLNDRKTGSRSMHVWVLKDGAWFLSRDIYQLLGALKQ